MKNLLVLLSLALAIALARAADPKPIKVIVGEEFKITLESNPASGNQWLMARPLDEKLLKLLGSEYKRGRPGAPGGGHEVLSFKAIAEGQTRIHLKYGKLWEHDSTPARATNFVVVVDRR